ncbi:hypothetical protein K1719_040891 [Acacia pycnantha]|nr:hypothetical protein K1719_040891 [Acacia pycnantha]
MSAPVNIIVGSHVWVEDSTQAWIDGEVFKINVMDELQGHNAALRDCIEQLTTIESLRASLVSHLREALQYQELKLDQL